jgi:hypothetical protein
VTRLPSWGLSWCLLWLLFSGARFPHTKPFVSIRSSHCVATKLKSNFANVYSTK